MNSLLSAAGSMSPISGRDNASIRFILGAYLWSLPLTMVFYQHYKFLLIVDVVFIIWAFWSFGVPRMMIYFCYYFLFLTSIHLCTIDQEVSLGSLIYYESIFLIIQGVALFLVLTQIHDVEFFLHKLFRYLFLFLIPIFFIQYQEYLLNIRERNYIAICCFFIFVFLFEMHDRKISFDTFLPLAVSLATLSRTAAVLSIAYAAILFFQVNSGRLRIGISMVGFVAISIFLFRLSGRFEGFFDNAWEDGVLHWLVTLDVEWALINLDRTRFLYHQLAQSLFEQLDSVSLFFGRSPLVDVLEGSYINPKFDWIVSWSSFFQIHRHFSASAFHSGSIKIIFEFGLLSYCLLWWVLFFSNISYSTKYRRFCCIAGFLLLGVVANTSVLFSLREVVPLFVALFLYCLSREGRVSSKIIRR